MKLLAIDGNSIMNRAFHGIKALSNKKRHVHQRPYGIYEHLS